MIGRSAIGLAALVVLTGCASPETHFYTLTSVPAQQTVAVKGLVEVDAVAIPAELDRLQIVRADTANRVAVLGVERWASPLDDQIRRVLTANLAARLGNEHVVRPGGSVAGETVRLVSVDIDQFRADATGRTVLAVQWAIVDDGRVAFRHFDAIDVDAGSAAIEAVPSAMSQAIGVLADRIAEKLGASADR